MDRLLKMGVYSPLLTDYITLYVRYDGYIHMNQYRRKEVKWVVAYY